VVLHRAHKALSAPSICAMSHASKSFQKQGPKSVKLEKKIGKVYLDFNATTPIQAELKAALPEVLEVWGNPSSIHWAGQMTKTLLRDARLSIAQALSVSPLELIFTSGGSEGNNTVLHSVFEKTRLSTRNEFITTNIEHPSVLKTLSHLKDLGATVHQIGVSKSGDLDWAHLTRVLSERTALVSVMLANNETGLILPLKRITEMAHAVGALVHTDAVQAFGKIPVNLSELGVDYASISAHKFYALKGSGVLFAKKGNDIKPLIYGGGQERSRRGGTENVLGIWAMGFMTSQFFALEARAAQVRSLRDQMESEILQIIPQARITHADVERLPNTSNLILEGVDGETLLMSLDVKGFAVSTGAACSSGNPEPSPILLAMGLTRSEAQSSLRVSIGWTTTEEEINSFIATLQQVATRLRSLHQRSEPTFQETTT
jgi:cysteine desulfurase